MSQFGEYARYYDLIYKDKPYEKECKFVDGWADYPHFILDIGCGTSSYWKYFSTEHIHGIEKSKEMINQSLFKDYIKHADITKIDPKILYLMHIHSYNCITALFDVINYIPTHKWWKHLPLRKGGYFIFDIWDKKKVDKDGFSYTEKKIGDFYRIMRPVQVHDQLKIYIYLVKRSAYEDKVFVWEIHNVYIWSEKDIKKFCGKEFKIVDKKETDTWQVWYKLQKK